MTKHTTGLANQPWVQELLTRESFTGREAGELAGTRGSDAITRLRADTGVRVVVLGLAAGSEHPNAKRYRLERVKGEA